MSRILIIDDESLIRALVAEVGTHLGHEVLSASSIQEGLRIAAEGVDVILLDVLLPDGDGLYHLDRFALLPERPDIIVITGHGDADAAESAIRSGAWEYLVKPLRARELTLALEQVIQWRTNRLTRTQIIRPQIIGNSPALHEALGQLREAADSNVNVLINGETGVGKELFAQALHANSARASRPFITVDCTTLPETLVEAQLFGHAKGAFTGADRTREGLLAAADTGTLFLDEVGDLPLAVQGAFLRALELKRFRPVGELREVASDFRVVAATNRDLDDMVSMELYRSDLRFRLRGMTITIPPLRRRQEDIPALAEAIVTQFCRNHAAEVKTITQGCLDLLMSYAWPGNVRELHHALERACAASGEGDALFARHLPTEIRIDLARRRLAPHRTASLPNAAATPPAAGTVAALPASSPPLQEPDQAAQKALNTTVAPSNGTDCPSPFAYTEPSDHANQDMPSLRTVKLQTEQHYLTVLLAHHRGDIRQAARIAGVSRGHLYELLRKHGLGKDLIGIPQG